MEVGARIAPGSSLLAIRGPVLEEGKPRFFRRIAKGEFDLADLDFRIKQLDRFLDWAKAEYGIGSPVAFGFSNGANVTWALMLSCPEVLRGAILMRPMRAFQPEKIEKLRHVPVLVIAGKKDATVPPSRADEVPSLLRSAGAEVQLAWVDAGHEFSAEDAETSAAWLARLEHRPQ